MKLDYFTGADECVYLYRWVRKYSAERERERERESNIMIVEKEGSQTENGSTLWSRNFSPEGAAVGNFTMKMGTVASVRAGAGGEAGGAIFGPPPSICYVL